MSARERERGGERNLARATRKSDVGGACGACAVCQCGPGEYNTTPRANVKGEHKMEQWKHWSRCARFSGERVRASEREGERPPAAINTAKERSPLPQRAADTAQSMAEMAWVPGVW